MNGATSKIASDAPWGAHRHNVGRGSAPSPPRGADQAAGKKRPLFRAGRAPYFLTGRPLFPHGARPLIFQGAPLNFCEAFQTVAPKRRPLIFLYVFY